MTGKKFEKKVDEANDLGLCKLYADRMDYDPSAKTVEELRLLSDKIPDNVKDNLQFAYYERRIAKLNDTRFRVLTGYGQCRGALIAHHGDVIVCCCREMATLIAYRNAYYMNGSIVLPDRRGDAARHNDGVYIISEGIGQTFTECPFCYATIQERIDLVKQEEDGPQEE
ncbi:MAG: hypothetical protein MJZ38_07455 [archaeon]|nr:hypothetical protein [archaeon]